MFICLTWDTIRPCTNKQKHPLLYCYTVHLVICSQSQTYYMVFVLKTWPRYLLKKLEIARSSIYDKRLNFYWSEHCSLFLCLQWNSIFLLDLNLLHFTSLSLKTGVSSTDWVSKALSGNKIDVLGGKSEHTTSSLNISQAVWTHHKQSEHITSSLNTPHAVWTHHKQSEHTTSSLNTSQAVWTYHKQSEHTTSSLNTPQAVWTHHKQSEHTTRSLNTPQAVWTHHKQSKHITS